MTSSRAVAAVLLLLLSASSASAAGPLNRGTWEITTQTIEPVLVPPMISVVCLSAEEADKPSPPKAKATDDCQIGVASQTNGGMSYVVRCAKAQSQVTTDLEFHGNTYSGTVTIQTPH